ncbi:MAG: 3-deoxy-D-manno-octulosonic acid kinase [Arenimonas sp.]
MESRAADIVDLQRSEGRYRDARGLAGIVFDRARLRQADASIFDQACYPGATQVDGEGGRGAAWFVDTEAGPAVIKHYRRGGAMRHVSTGGYVWLGERQVRSVREYALLRTMGDLGLPVPVPLAAGWERDGLVYRASLMTLRINGVESFAAVVSARGADAPWDVVGGTLARFHKPGYRHADLNAHNVLVGPGDAIHVIDWDKGRIELAGGRWPDRVLDRLERSLRKQLPDLDDDVLRAGMARLRIAHAKGLGA